MNRFEFQIAFVLMVATGCTSVANSPVGATTARKRAPGATPSDSLQGGRLLSWRETSIAASSDTAEIDDTLLAEASEPSPLSRALAAWNAFERTPPVGPDPRFCEEDDYDEVRCLGLTPDRPASRILEIALSTRMVCSIESRRGGRSWCRALGEAGEHTWEDVTRRRDFKPFFANDFGAVHARVDRMCGRRPPTRQNRAGERVCVRPRPSMEALETSWEGRIVHDYDANHITDIGDGVCWASLSSRGRARISWCQTDDFPFDAAIATKTSDDQQFCCAYDSVDAEHARCEFATQCHRTIEGGRFVRANHVTPAAVTKVIVAPEQDAACVAASSHTCCVSGERTHCVERKAWAMNVDGTYCMQQEHLGLVCVAATAAPTPLQPPPPPPPGVRVIVLDDMSSPPDPNVY